VHAVEKLRHWVQRRHNPYDALVCAAGIKVRPRELPAVRNLSCTEGE